MRKDAVDATALMLYRKRAAEPLGPPLLIAAPPADASDEVGFYYCYNIGFYVICNVTPSCHTMSLTVKVPELPCGHACAPSGAQEVKVHGIDCQSAHGADQRPC